MSLFLGNPYFENHQRIHAVFSRIDTIGEWSVELVFVIELPDCCLKPQFKIRRADLITAAGFVIGQMRDSSRNFFYRGCLNDFIR
jgi:2-keto-4-pentenoate hydratase